MFQIYEVSTKSHCGEGLDESLDQFLGLKDLIARNLSFALAEIEKVYYSSIVNDENDFFNLIKDFLKSFILMWAGCKKEFINDRGDNQLIADLVKDEKLLFCILLLFISFAKTRYKMMDNYELRNVWIEIEKLVS